MGLVNASGALRRITRRLVLLAAFPVGLAPAQDAEMRTWKDVGNRFKIQARFVSVSGENVILKKADNTQVQVALEKLCSADRAYVAARQKPADEDPFKPVAGDPPRAEPASSRPTARATAGASPAPATARPGAPARRNPAPTVVAVGGQATEIRPDWSSAQLAALPPIGAWKVEVPPASPPAAAADAALRGVPLPTSRDFFEHLKGFAANAPGTHALVGYTLEHPSPGTARVLYCDLKAGAVVFSAPLTELLSPLSLSDAGDRALMGRKQTGFGKSDLLELWDLSPQGPTRVWKLTPYDDAKGGDREVAWAAFVGPKRFATVNRKGKLGLWELESPRAATTLQLAAGCIPALSPDGRLLAFSGDGNLGLLDVQADQVVALQPMPEQQTIAPRFGFSPSGGRLAGVGNGKLYVWGVEDGALQSEILLSPVPVLPDEAPIWTGEGHVLIANRYLIDVESGVKLWDYDGAEDAAVVRDGLTWFVLPARPNQAGALIPARIPQASVLQALKQALADPNGFALRPGATVAVSVSGIADAAERPKVAAVLAAKLEAMEMKVAASAPLVLVAATEVGKEEEISYRSMGAGLRTDTFRVRPQVSKVRLTYQGQQVWDSSASTLPRFDFAHLGPNESLADHVKKFEKPDYAFFDSIAIPPLLPRPRANGSFTLGRSQVSTAGVR